MYPKYVRSLLWIAFACFLAGCAGPEKSAKQDPPAVSAHPAAAQLASTAPQGVGLPAGSAPTPVMVVPETSHDFGAVKIDGDYLYHFKVKNEGTAVLEIRKVLPG